MFCELFVVWFDYLLKLSSVEFAVDPLHLRGRNQDPITMKLSFIKLTNVLVAITEQFLTKGFDCWISIVSFFDEFEV